MPTRRYHRPQPHTHTHTYVYGICCIYALGQAVWLRDGVIKIRDTDCQILANKLTSDRAKATAQKARFMGSAAGWAGQVVMERGRRGEGSINNTAQHKVTRCQFSPVESTTWVAYSWRWFALAGRRARRGGSVRRGVEGGGCSQREACCAGLGRALQIN